MPRFRHALTGVAVSVDDATAARLGAMYEPIRAEAPESKPDPKPAPKRRAPARKKQ